MSEEQEQQDQPQQPAPAPGPATTSTGTGLDPKLAGLLCYLFGWVSGLIFFLIEKDDKTVRFHALQSIFLSVAVFAVYFVFSFLIFVPGVTVIAFTLLPFIYLAFLVISIVLMVKAYQGEKWKLPIIGDIAEKNA